MLHFYHTKHMWAGPTQRNKKNISLLAACLLAPGARPAGYNIIYYLSGAIACNDTGNVLGLT
jgi:hypothetical protein